MYLDWEKKSVKHERSALWSCFWPFLGAWPLKRRAVHLDCEKISNSKRKLCDSILDTALFGRIISEEMRTCRDWQKKTNQRVASCLVPIFRRVNYKETRTHTDEQERFKVSLVIFIWNYFCLACVLSSQIRQSHWTRHQTSNVKTAWLQAITSHWIFSSQGEWGEEITSFNQSSPVLRQPSGAQVSTVHSFLLKTAVNKLSKELCKHSWVEI